MNHCRQVQHVIMMDDGTLTLNERNNILHVSWMPSRGREWTNTYCVPDYADRCNALRSVSLRVGFDVYATILGDRHA